jgi:hypothetical protein
MSTAKHSNLIACTGVLFAMVATKVVAQSARDILGPAPVVPLASQPPARLIIDPPIPEALAAGRVFIQYRAENLRIVPVFGPAALAVSPRVGHIHVTVDDAPWHWADASGEQLIITGLPAGKHKVLIELVNANHQTLDEGVVEFMVPIQAVPAGHP